MSDAFQEELATSARGTRARNLRWFGTLFRVLAVFAVLALVIAGFNQTEARWALMDWALAVGALIQGLWFGSVSEALAMLLESK